MIWIGVIVIALVVGIAIYDLTQRQHAILRTFPILGHFRYWLEAIGPELRQYIVTDNDEERPSAATSAAGSTPRPSARTTTSASAPTTRWSCSRNYLIIKHDTFPLPAYHPGRSGVRSRSSGFRARR